MENIKETQKDLFAKAEEKLKQIRAHRKAIEIKLSTLSENMKVINEEVSSSFFEKV